MPGKHISHQKEKESLALSCPFQEKDWRLNTEPSKPMSVKGPRELSLRPEDSSGHRCLWRESRAEQAALPLGQFLL